MDTFTVEFYKKLVEAVENLPKAAVERTKKSDTHKGYDTTGYQYQYLVNVLNEVISPAGWSMDYQVIQTEKGAYRSGQPFWDVTVETTVTVLGSVRKCVGGHVSASYTDAYKGAITNAFKKTVALFGVGKSAYEGSLDDDYRPLPDSDANRVSEKVSASQNATQKPYTAPGRTEIPKSDLDTTQTAPAQNTASCDCGRTMRQVPSGVSKKTGKRYNAFWSCDPKAGGCGKTRNVDWEMPEEQIPTDQIPF